LLAAGENVKMVDHKAAKANVTTTDTSAKPLDKQNQTNNQELDKNGSTVTTQKLSQRSELLYE
jgi:hypothetical protein